MKQHLVAFAAIALAASPALAAKTAHTWFDVDYAHGKCERSQMSPETFSAWTDTPLGHQMGYASERIAPGDVIKDDKGNIQVNMSFTRNGAPMEAHFFTSKEACDAYVKDNDITAQQADDSDLN
jgi:hypothetical protein